MNGLIRICFAVFCLGLAQLASAHDSNLATFHIRHLDDGQWFYEVRTPLRGLDQSLRATTGEDLSDSIVGSIEYKQLIVAHIKEGFDVSVSGKSVNGVEISFIRLSLGQGRINLDAHMSTLIFEIIGMPAEVDGLDFRLANMSNNSSQNNILRLIEGDENQRYMLNQENNFSGMDRGFFK